MKSLKELIIEAGKSKTAIGHFNFSDLVTFWAIFRAAQKLNLPVIVGLSEGEREFVGVRQAAALIKSVREEYDWPIFLNADHTYSLPKLKEVVKAGYDSVIFDVADLPLEENIRKTKEVVEYVKSINPDILVEGELGYIGRSSQLLEAIPEGAAVTPEMMTDPEEAAQFVKETGIDLLAPAVGNIHGLLKDADNPALDIERIRALREAIRQVQGKQVPLVLHGGSGLKNEDFLKAIEAGVSIIHINTEIRLIWKEELRKSLEKNMAEAAPYKLLKPVEESVHKLVSERLKLFSRLL